MSNIVILGAQWGDEGKGKLVDLLADRFDYIVRYQGGHNAGHTILIGDRKFVLRLVPSGILHPGKVAVIGNGLVVDPLALIEELDQLTAAGVDIKTQLRIGKPRSRSASHSPSGRKDHRSRARQGSHRHDLTRHRTVLSGQSCAPWHSRGRSPRSRILSRRRPRTHAGSHHARPRLRR